MGLPIIPVIVLFTGTFCIGYGYWRFVLTDFYFPEEKKEFLEREAVRGIKRLQYGNSYGNFSASISEKCSKYITQVNECLKMSKNNQTLCKIYIDDLCECQEKNL